MPATSVNESHDLNLRLEKMQARLKCLEAKMVESKSRRPAHSGVAFPSLARGNIEGIELGIIRVNDNDDDNKSFLQNS